MIFCRSVSVSGSAKGVSSVATAFVFAAVPATAPAMAAASLTAPVGKDVAQTAFEAAHELLQAAQGDALPALLEPVQGRGREAELFGKPGEGHPAAPGAEEIAELGLQ